jgi:hypothetical protein
MFSRDFFLDDHPILTIDLPEQDRYFVLPGGDYLLPYIIGLNGKLSMATVDKHSQLDDLGAPKIDQSVHRRPDGPSRVQHIIHQDDPFIPQSEGNLCLAHERPGEANGEVIPVKSDVDDSRGNSYFFDLVDLPPDALGQIYTARANANQN